MSGRNSYANRRVLIIRAKKKRHRNAKGKGNKTREDESRTQLNRTRDAVNRMPPW